ncbi:MAG TPA: hypothetical protein VEV41_06215 [Terriglobales bacterium]|nr:hypothetical protein [Terriglobales bacterium]
MLGYRRRTPIAFLSVVLVFCSFSLLPATLADSLAQQAHGDSSPAALISCSPDTPITQTGTEVPVRAFVGLRDQEPRLEYAWTANAGNFQGSGPQASWSLKNVLPGRYKATVAVSNSGTKLGECSIGVIVVEAERGTPGTAQRDTARSFLVKGQKEKGGYGLYSYFLLGSPPTDSSRARYLKAIQAYVNLIPIVSGLEDYVSADKLNLTYFPTKSPLPPKPTDEWLLENYDFARARMLLDLLPGVHNDGPYFVSALKPLSGAERVASQYLFQDLSGVPPEGDLMSSWIKEFMSLAAQERFWEPKTAEVLTLKLRTTISVLAAGLPEVKKQLASWVAWTG